jgi:hypothetical protein
MGWKINSFERVWFNQRLQKPIYDLLKKLAIEQGRSMSAVCQQALREHFGLPEWPGQLDVAKARPEGRAKARVAKSVGRRLPLR